MLYEAFVSHLITTLNHYNNPRSPHAARKMLAALKRDGFEVLGNGHFSVALAHAAAPGKVFKMGLRPEDSAPLYLGWCRTQTMKYLPRVYDLRMVYEQHIAVLDRLTPVERGLDPLSCQIRAEISSSMLTSEYARLDHLFPDLGATLREVGRVFYAFSTDLHSGNVMLDQNKQLVITDPVAYVAGAHEQFDSLSRVFGLA